MICLDSDYIIDFLKGKKEAVEIVQKYQEEIVTTEINVFEVFLGAYMAKNNSEKEETAATNLFNSIEILSKKKGSGKMAAKTLSELSKKGEIIGQNDIFVSSIMQKNNCNQIITGNTKHFSKLKGIEIIPISQNSSHSST